MTHEHRTPRGRDRRGKEDVTSAVGAEPAQPGEGGSDAGGGSGGRGRFAAAMTSVKGASDRHLALLVPLQAVERNRRVASSVLAGGLAYRLFLWLLPFGLLLGGGLGLMDAKSTEDAVEEGGLPGAVTDAIGDAARDVQGDSWWLLIVGVGLLLWAGYTGAKAVELVHSLVWDEPPPTPKPLKMSLAFTAMCCAFIAAIAFTWWVREDWPFIFAPVITFAPLAGLWLWISLLLPHRDAPWKALLPGAFVVAIGFQVLHEVIGWFLVPKLEKSTSLYGSLGATTTLLFFMYMLGILVVTSPVINSTLYDELRKRNAGAGDDATEPAGAPAA